ncbi:MAG: MoaD/ThiS family protein [Methanobacterium sp.]|uniref:MoaD/ThiS family protein n=1 Tax=Methanobacterium sp. TaxID=2164 RepID=UPI003C78440A
MNKRVEVKFLTRFLDITGERKTQIDDVNKVSDLINILLQKYGEKFKDLLLDANGNLRDYLKIMINGEDIRDIDGLETPLKDGDQVVMFQTIAGG